MLERLVLPGAEGREGPLSIGRLVAVTWRCDIPINILRLHFVFSRSVRKSGSMIDLHLYLSKENPVGSKCGQMYPSKAYPFGSRVRGGCPSKVSKPVWFEEPTEMRTRPRQVGLVQRMHIFTRQRLICWMKS